MPQEGKHLAWFDMAEKAFIQPNNPPSFHLDCDGDGVDDDTVWYVEPYSYLKESVVVQDLDRDNITIDFIYNDTIFYFDFEFEAFNSNYSSDAP